jgi:hypothetical protein
MELTLNDEQASLLAEVLHQTYRELRFEIADTDNPDFKRHLQQRRQTLQRILDQVESQRP